MRHIDKHLNQDCTVATPALLFDGHGSRFDFEFLKYINPINKEDGKKWYTVLGSPYGTSLLQVGDTRRENENYKRYTYLRKAEVLEQKRVLHNFHSGINLTKDNIVHIACYTWRHRFANEGSNLAVTVDRGWNSMDFCLLDHNKVNQQTVNHGDNDETKQKVWDELTMKDLNF